MTHLSSSTIGGTKWSWNWNDRQFRMGRRDGLELSSIRQNQQTMRLLAILLLSLGWLIATARTYFYVNLFSTGSHIVNHQMSLGVGIFQEYQEKLEEILD